MYPVRRLNGPIGGEESWCKGFAHPECDREDPAAALPGLRQASPKSSASTLDMHALDAHLTS